MHKVYTLLGMSGGDGREHRQHTTITCRYQTNDYWPDAIDEVREKCIVDGRITPNVFENIETVPLNNILCKRVRYLCYASKSVDTYAMRHIPEGVVRIVAYQ